MSNASSPLSQARLDAYTGVRADIAGLVPLTAKRILDLGCSDGALGEALKAQLRGRTITGVEFSPLLAEKARPRLDTVIQADLNQARALDVLKEQQFDCAICADVLEHLYQPEVLLRELRQLLSADAALVVSLPNVRHLSAFASIYLRGTFPRRQRGIFDDTHFRWFTLRDGHRMLTEAGFIVKKFDYSLRWGDVGGGIANRLLSRLVGPLAPYALPVREFLSYQFAMQAELQACQDAENA